MERMSKKQILEKKIKTIFYGVCAGFLVSYIYTVCLIKSDTVGFWAFIPVLVVSGVIDGLKTVTAFAKSNTKYDSTTRTRSSVFYYLTLGVSLLASFAYTNNQSNARSNITYTKSLEYQEYTKTKERLNNSIATKQKQIDSLSDKFLTKKLNLGAEIDSINETLSNLKAPKEVQFKSVNGFIGSCKLLVDLFKFQFTPETLKLLIFLTITFIFEFGLGELARFYNKYIEEYNANYGDYHPDHDNIKLADTDFKKDKIIADTLENSEKIEQQIQQYLTKFLSVDTLKPNTQGHLDFVMSAEKDTGKKQAEEDTRNTEVSADEDKRKIGFQFDEKSNKFTNEQLEAYKEIMFRETEKNDTNISLGVRAICDLVKEEKNIDIPKSLGFKIKNHLEVGGIVESKDQKTYILNN